MEEKLNNVIMEYESITGKSVNPNSALKSTSTSTLFSTSTSTSNSTTFYEPTLNFFQKYKIVFYVMLGVFALILYIKPGFCYVYNKKKDKLVFSWMRVLIYTIIMSIVILLGFYFYKSKYLNNSE
jgi:hypothetical protein